MLPCLHFYGHIKPVYIYIYILLSTCIHTYIYICMSEEMWTSPPPQSQLGWLHRRVWCRAKVVRCRRRTEPATNFLVQCGDLLNLWHMAWPLCCRDTYKLLHGDIKHIQALFNLWKMAYPVCCSMFSQVQSHFSDIKMNQQPGTVCTIQPGKGHLRVHGWALLQGLLMTSVTPFSDWMMRYHMEPQTQLTLCMVTCPRSRFHHPRYKTAKGTHRCILFEYYICIYIFWLLASIQITGWKHSLFGMAVIESASSNVLDLRVYILMPWYMHWFVFSLFHNMALYPILLDTYSNMLMHFLYFDVICLFIFRCTGARKRHKKFLEILYTP